MVFLKKLPSSLTARPILEFLQSKAARECTGWFTIKCLDQLYEDPKYSTQLENMYKIDEALDKIKQNTPHELKERTDWQNLNTRIFHSEMGICHKYKLMQAVLSNKKNIDRRHELVALSKGILDVNNGVLSNLSIIHQVLLGRTATNSTEKGLLEMWSEGIYINMKINIMSAKTYQDYVNKFMTKAAILQMKGILLFAGANTNSDFCRDQFDLFLKNLESQIKTIEQTVPSYMKYLSDPDEKDVFVMRPVFDGDFNPFVRRWGPGKKVTNEYFCRNIEEGKWNFEKSSSFVNDGSLLISGRNTTNDQRYYMRVSKTNKAECVSEKCNATPFCVVPLGFENKTMKTIVCKAELHDQRFLGNTLTCIDEQDDSLFTLTFE